MSQFNWGYIELIFCIYFDNKDLIKAVAGKEFTLFIEFDISYIGKSVIFKRS